MRFIRSRVLMIIIGLCIGLYSTTGYVCGAQSALCGNPGDADCCENLSCIPPGIAGTCEENAT